MSLVSVCKNSKTVESKIEDQNLIIYTKTDEIENWKSDLVLHVRTKVVKPLLVTGIVDRNVLTDFMNLIYVTNIRVSYQKIIFWTGNFSSTYFFHQIERPEVIDFYFRVWTGLHVIVVEIVQSLSTRMIKQSITIRFWNIRHSREMILEDFIIEDIDSELVIGPHPHGRRIKLKKSSFVLEKCKCWYLH